MNPEVDDSLQHCTFIYGAHFYAVLHIKILVD